ncbi:hypothetical protein SYJ56_04530 [Algoriphagus sp. D3-2-R+10]|uniref:hypothetical protein n=1 Tax=Algoriphagus aurantiacus TaxID=3103948 RepID=UPI002B3C8356|nr:hypothetical protein [Algoriphagus sp. D3-2-R+10]MEB2774558.1 hypothetical protein [Algoriphagus sp. D3-2-R+10]
MNSKVTQEELDEYVSKVPDFIDAAEESIRNSIFKVEQIVIELSNAALSDDFREAKRLLIAILNFIQKCKSGIVGKSTETISEKLTLIVNYYQSVHHTEDLLLRGQYIAVAALMKKDFETMVKLREISAGKAKYGKTPNANHAPKELKFIYGQLNDVAHISKNHAISFYVEKSDGYEVGVSASPQFKEEQFKSFYAYHLSIMQTILAEAISLYKEMYGIDKNYKDMMSYFVIANDVINQIGEKYLEEEKGETKME